MINVCNKRRSCLLIDLVLGLFDHFLLISVQLKQTNTISCPLFVVEAPALAPTAMTALKKVRAENASLKMKLDATKEQLKSLQNERDFLREQLSQGKKRGDISFGSS